MTHSKIDWDKIDREERSNEIKAMERFATYLHDASPRMIDTCARLDQGDDQYYYEINAREIDALFAAFGVLHLIGEEAP